MPAGTQSRYAPSEPLPVARDYDGATPAKQKSNRSTAPRGGFQKLASKAKHLCNANVCSEEYCYNVSSDGYDVSGRFEC